MKTVRIRQKGRLFSRNCTRQLPESWAELSGKQLVWVAGLYLHQLDSKAFLRGISRLPLDKLDAFQLYKVSGLLEFINDCRIHLDRFLIASIGRLEAPGQRLKGMTFERFMLVDTAFNRYVRHESEEALDHLVALLYLQKGERVVLPQELSKGLFLRQKVLNLPRRLKWLAKVDKSVKYAVFLNYVFIKHWLSKSFPWLFPMQDEDEQTGKRRHPQAPSVNWLDIFDAFVGDDIAQMDKFRQMPATTAFRLLNKRIRDAQKKKK